MAQLNRRRPDPWIRDIQITCPTPAGMDSHDIGPPDSGVFSFQDGEEQGGKRAIGPGEGILKSIRTATEAETGRHPLLLNGGQQRAKTGKKITPLTQGAKSSNFSCSQPGENQTVDK